MNIEQIAYELTQNKADAEKLIKKTLKALESKFCFERIYKNVQPMKMLRKEMKNLL